MEVEAPKDPPEEPAVPWQGTTVGPVSEEHTGRAAVEIRDVLADQCGDWLLNPSLHRGQLAGRIQVELDAKDLSDAEKVNVYKRLEAQIHGYDRIDPLMRDASVTEVILLSPSEILAETDGTIVATGIEFRDQKSYDDFIDNLVAGTGRPLDQRNPVLDAELLDGTRVNVTRDPVSKHRSANLRKPPVMTKVYTPAEYVATRACPPEMMDQFVAYVRARLNILILGPTSSSKTTLMRILAGFVPADLFMIVLEETRELNLPRERTLALQELRSATGEVMISLNRLFTAVLRKRPDLIWVGEVRETEILAILRSILAGHDGIVATMHAGSPQNVIDLLVLMAKNAGMLVTEERIERLVRENMNLLIFTDRDLKTAGRLVTSVWEVMPVGHAEDFRQLWRYDWENGQHLELATISDRHRERFVQYRAVLPGLSR
jgi:pilus assembly protein CpaF